MKKFGLVVVTTALLFNIAGISQTVYVFDNNDHLGVADLSSGAINKWFMDTGHFWGPTQDICVLPDGKIYRSNQIWGSLISLAEPLFENDLQNGYWITNNGIINYARAISCNYNSVLFISCIKVDTSVWMHGILESYDLSQQTYHFYSYLDNYYQALTCIGDKVIALEEVLYPYRYYNLLELDLNDLKHNRLLFQIDSSFWPLKNYAPIDILSPYFNFFNVYESCDSVQTYIQSNIRYDNNNWDSTFQVYRIDYKNKTLVKTCKINFDHAILSGGIDGINPFGFLKDCRLDLDLDLDNSSVIGNDYSCIYSCPMDEKSIHDKDWNFYCDGPLDSIQVEITSTISDNGQEYLLSKYQPMGLNILGNGTSYLRLIATRKFYSNEIINILDGIVYYNGKLFPTNGARDIRVSIYVPWLQDTVNCRIMIPHFASAGKDSLVILCPNKMIYHLEDYLEDGGVRKGSWLESEVLGGDLIAGVTPPGKYHFLLYRGDCFPDTAVIQVQYYSDINLKIGNDTLVDENTIQKIIATANFTGNEIIHWFKGDTLLNETGNEISFEAKEDIFYSIEVITNNGCIFRDRIEYRVNSNKDLWISNVFSPNGDNINDIFYVKSKYQRKLLKFEIYNRWGNLVFVKNNILSNDESQGWNGEMNNQKVSPGVYIYNIEYKGSNGQALNKVGDICLIR